MWWARRVGSCRLGVLLCWGRGERRVESDRNLNPSYLFPASLPNPLVLCLIGKVYFGFKYFSLLSHFFFAFEVISCQLGGFCIVCSEFCSDRRPRSVAGFSWPMWSSVSLGVDWCASMVVVSGCVVCGCGSPIGDCGDSVWKNGCAVSWVDATRLGGWVGYLGVGWDGCGGCSSLCVEGGGGTQWVLMWAKVSVGCAWAAGGVFVPSFCSCGVHVFLCVPVALIREIIRKESFPKW